MSRPFYARGCGCAPAGILALLNEELTDYATHRASAVFHNPADTINTVSTAVVTTLMLDFNSVAVACVVPAADTALFTCPLIAFALPPENPPFMMSVASAMI